MTSILVNGQHWNWEKIDPAEAEKWKELEGQAKALFEQQSKILDEQLECTKRTREKYENEAKTQ